MTTEQITQLLHNHYSPEDIFNLEIKICPINLQIESIEILFKEGFNRTFEDLGNLLRDIDKLVTYDEYGDITEMTFQYSDFGSHIDGTGATFTFTFNIDS